MKSLQGTRHRDIDTLKDSLGYFNCDCVSYFYEKKKDETDGQMVSCGRFGPIASKSVTTNRHFTFSLFSSKTRF